jgi:hypothetical protein
VDHGRTRSVSGTEECMSYGCTQEACQIDDENSAPRVNPNLALTGDTNNWHEDYCPPDSCEKDIGKSANRL